MIVSPACMAWARFWTVCSVGPPAGTIIQTARGGFSLLTRSCREDDPTAPSPTRPFTASALRSETTSWWPPRIRRRVMLAPILPNPTIPSCISALLKKEMLAECFLDSVLKRTKARGEIGTEMHTQGTTSAFRQHLEVAARLRCFHDSECVFLPGHRKILRIVTGQLQEDA